MDTVSKEKRHEIMPKIRGKDTTIKIQVRHWLYNAGIGYRKNCKDIVGTPDISIMKYKIAVFVNGCFWHGHTNCKLSHIPKTNVDFWEKKIKRNRERDREVIDSLEASGWNVFISGNMS